MVPPKDGATIHPQDDPPDIWTLQISPPPFHEVEGFGVMISWGP